MILKRFTLYLFTVYSHLKTSLCCLCNGTLYKRGISLSWYLQCRKPGLHFVDKNNWEAGSSINWFLVRNLFSRLWGTYLLFLDALCTIILTTGFVFCSSLSASAAANIFIKVWLKIDLILDLHENVLDNLACQDAFNQPDAHNILSHLSALQYIKMIKDNQFPPLVMIWWFNMCACD